MSCPITALLEETGCRGQLIGRLIDSETHTSSTRREQVIKVCYLLCKGKTGALHHGLDSSFLLRWYSSAQGLWLLSHVPLSSVGTVASVFNHITPHSSSGVTIPVCNKGHLSALPVQYSCWPRLGSISSPSFCGYEWLPSLQPAWVIWLHSCTTHIDPEVRGTVFLRNIGIHIQYYRLCC